MELDWTGILMSCFPFFVVITIWIIIVRGIKKNNKTVKTNYENKYNEMSGLLKEIRDELKELNKNNSQKQ
jgi:large-conductance mechanosensitive channel